MAHLRNLAIGARSLASFDGQRKMLPKDVARKDQGVMTPRNFAIEPTGQTMRVANELGGNVIVFRINPSTGELTPTESLPAGWHALKLCERCGLRCGRFSCIAMLIEDSGRATRSFALRRGTGFSQGRRGRVFKFQNLPVSRPVIEELSPCQF
jgi:hypothetical protein